MFEILTPCQDLHNKKVLITAGGTEENIDGVRVITNHSSGKMGVALAKEVANRGGEPIFIYGNITVDLPNCLSKSIKVTSTMDMLKAVQEEQDECDIAIMAAAPSDYKLKKPFENKIKSETLTLELEKNPDIAKTYGENKKDKKLIIFSAETENLVNNAKAKLVKKNADLVVANDVTLDGAGFNGDTNIATIIDKFGNETKCELMQKTELASKILDKVVEIL